MQLIRYAKSTAVALFALGAAASVPLAPAVAAPPCAEAVQFCNLYSSFYNSIQECLEAQVPIWCPPGEGPFNAHLALKQGKAEPLLSA